MATEKLKTQLRINRGTYDEIQALPTVDMEFYLAWDTQEFFVGNSKGIKTPYLGGKNLTEREINDLIEFFIDGRFEIINGSIDTLVSDLEIVQNQIVALGIVNTDLNKAMDILQATMNQIEATIGTTVENYLTTTGTSLFYTKDQTVNEIDIWTYDKSTIESKFSTMQNTIAQTQWATATMSNNIITLENISKMYQSVIVHDVTVDEMELIATLDDYSSAPGIYRIDVDGKGYELFIINTTGTVRISSDGHNYLRVENSWEQVDADIPSSYSADIVFNTLTRKWNNVLPDEDGIVNKEGRQLDLNGEPITAGINSTAFGFESAAMNPGSSALGYFAVANAENAIQLGHGSNSEANTLKFRNNTLVEADGKIPNDRIKETFNNMTLQLTIDSWNSESKQSTLTVTGMTNASLVWVSPAPVSIADYSDNSIRAISQGTNFLVFECDVIPTTAISVNIIFKELL